MKGIVWHGPEQMSVDEVPEPSVEPGTVVVRPTAVGICGSEIEGYLGRMGNRTPPLVMGHEFAGTVTEIGEGVDEDLLGRLVAVNPLSSDGTCRLCLAGLTNLCPNRKLVGIHSPGGFAEYTLAPAANVYPLPDGVEARTGALAEPLANGVHAARLGLAGASAEHAVVVGAGTIGLMCLQAAVLEGVPEVHVVEPVAGAPRAGALPRRRRRPRDPRGGSRGPGGADRRTRCGPRHRRCRGRSNATDGPRISCGPAEGSCTSGCTTTTRRSGSTTSCGANSTCRARTRTRPKTSSRRSSGSSRAGPVSGSYRPCCRSRRDRRRSPSWYVVRRRRSKSSSRRAE